MVCQVICIKKNELVDLLAMPASQSESGLQKNVFAIGSTFLYALHCLTDNYELQAYHALKSGLHLLPCNESRD